MASYRYERDIDPADLAPRAEKQYTRKERWANWWDYNLKWVLLIGIAAAFVAYSFIGQYFFTIKPDYNVAVVAPYYLPDDTVTALQEQLAQYGEDLNGDGKTVVTLNVYTLDYSAGDTQTESDAYLTMAGTTKLATDVAGGVGSAPVYPQVKWLHEHGIAADVIVGSKTKDLLILEKEMESVAGNLYVTTDDGSYGRSGMVTQTIKDLVAEGKKYDLCIAIGPMIMMKFVCLLTKELEIPTVVSLNPIMVDGTGMCGACRVTVGGKVKFACVDGPEFDGHEVNFDEAMRRQQIYKTAEGRAMLALEEGETHHGGCGNCQ